MARQENAFALLGDEEGDDVSSLVERVSAKVEISKEKEKEKKPKNQQLQTAPEAARFPSKPPPPTEAGDWPSLFVALICWNVYISLIMCLVLIRV